MGERQLGQLFRQSGSRYTPQRLAVLNYLQNTDTHPTAEMIFNSLRDDYPNLSLATVYNVLKLFSEKGVVRELKFGKYSSRYEWYHGNHHHVYCTSCGKTADFQFTGADEIGHSIGKATAFQSVDIQLNVYGLCGDCHKLN